MRIVAIMLRIISLIALLLALTCSYEIAEAAASPNTAVANDFVRPATVRREQSTPVESLTRARTLKLLGDKHSRSGGLVQAIRYYRVAAHLVRDDPSDIAVDLCSRCDMNTIHCHWLRGEFRDGLRQCTAHLLWQGNHISDQQLAKCLVRRARCLHGLQKLELAASDLRRAMRLRPDDNAAKKEFDKLGPLLKDGDEPNMTDSGSDSAPDPVAVYHTALGEEDGGYLSVEPSEEEVDSSIDEAKQHTDLLPTIPTSTAQQPAMNVPNIPNGPRGIMDGLSQLPPGLLQSNNLTISRVLELVDNFLERFEQPQQAATATSLLKSTLTEDVVGKFIKSLPGNEDEWSQGILTIVHDWNEQSTMAAARWGRLGVHTIRVLNNVRDDVRSHAELISYALAFVWFVGATST